ncbi:MAG TPA: cytochrome c oxidase subunit 3 [Polyangia bacterium]|nr:cytochrome c oxidase subunit 3 [Polyangia bacterium]
MSAAPVEVGRTTEPRLDTLPPEESRGTWGMSFAILTETLLFVSLFFAYFYVRSLREDWLSQPPPHIRLALVLLAVLLVSSGTLELAKHALARSRAFLARFWLALTVALGGAFVVVQAMEYRRRLRDIRPTTNVYGSLFYAVTTFHALHVVVGLAMLVFVLFLPRLRPARGPRRPLENAALYWHFVDAVWVVVVALLYVLPQRGRP